MVDIQSRFQVRSFAKFPRTSPSRGGSWNAIAPALLRRSLLTIPTVYPTSERYGLSDRHHQPWWWWKTLLVGLVRGNEVDSESKTSDDDGDDPQHKPHERGL